MYIYMYVFFYSIIHLQHIGMPLVHVNVNFTNESAFIMKIKSKVSQGLSIVGVSVMGMSIVGASLQLN